jgi:TonB family protein
VNFDANGKRRLHETYDRGILTGHQEWNERGILVKADFFSAGQKNGRCYWNAAGLDSARVSYCDYFNGQKNGEERLVDSDGTITVTFYSLDVRNGTYQRTSSSGKLQETGMYDNGRKIGLWVQADATGARTLTYYGAPPRSGGDSRVSTNIPELIGFDSCVSLYPNGRVRMIQRVKDRKNEFYTAICYDTNGVKNAFGFYRKDKRDSLWTTYYPNKKVSSTLRYYTGTPRGVYQAWYPSGKLMFKVPLGGDRVGDYLTFYDDKGREQPYNTKEADDVLRPFFWPNTDVHWQKFEHQGESTSNGEELFTTADVMPEFPGGMEGLSSFLQKNIQYPEMAREAGVQGKVFISFNILKDGSVSDVKVEKSADPSLDKEAVRVVKMMPRWNPGKQNGKPVAVHMTLPVNFSLR